jgi:hypothetical protein
MDIAMTERGDFRRCRRAWNFQSANGLSLVRKGIPAVHFYVGNAFHAAMEGQALGLQPMEVLEAWFERKRTQYARDYAEQYGVSMDPRKLHQLKEPEALVRAMVEQYFDNYGWENPLESQGLKYIAPEISFRLPIPGVFDTAGEQVYLVGTIDGLAEELDNPDNYWLVEHKTYSQKVSLDQLMFDDQMTGYSYAAWQLLGKPATGLLYDGANKVKPKKPAVLIGESKWKGRLSRAIEGPMTFRAYHAAILELGHDPTDEYYAPVLHKLKMREEMDENSFFVRHRVDFNEDQMLQWEQDLIQEARDMVAVAANPKLQYPNRPWSGCWDCDVQDLCATKQLGGDLEEVIAENYTVGTYGTRQAQKDMEPETVGSLSDLRSLIERRKQELLAA